MLTGQGLIGKLIELLATTLLKRQIDITLDDRKHACRSLVELYFCLDGLERATHLVIEELRPRNDSLEGWVVVNAFALHGQTLDSLSQRFFDIGPELHRALKIIDPVLADALHQLYAFKYSLLSFLSTSVEFKNFDGERNRLLVYKQPDDRILTIDMDAYYEWLAMNPLNSISWEQNLEWPRNLLARFEYEEAFHTVEVDTANSTALLEFRDLLVKHSAALTAARAALRELISKNFKLEEVLYVSRDIPEQGL